MPPELKVKKSVILPRVDDIIYEKHIIDIGEELQKQNPWIGEEIVDIYKFPKSPTLKITFSQTTLALKCTEKGIKAFSISVPPHEIKQETYVPIKCCMKCYSLETHFTSECPMPREYKICSECSEEGHVWHQCQNTTKKCLNCNEDHSSMAMKCGKRKEILKEKRNQITERQKMNYATISQITPSATTMPNFQTPTVTKEELLKIHICVAHAQNKDQITPGTYKSELNKMLKVNNLPTIIIPEEPDTTTNVTQGQQVVGAMAMDANDSESKPQARTPKLSRHSSTGSLIEKTLDASEIGL
ncbi:MAG: hypothetical protein DSY42_09145 [Aquifex sp.]|nr:MAG: hypothetical protein DSY42_09145 [Aquifex sp.]